MTAGWGFSFYHLRDGKINYITSQTQSIISMLWRFFINKPVAILTAVTEKQFASWNKSEIIAIPVKITQEKD